LKKLRVLYVAHGHPAVRAGGAEQHAYELFEAMRETGRVEPFLLARSGEAEHVPPPGTLLRPIGDHTDQALLHTGGMDYFFYGQRDKRLFTVHLKQFLSRHRPEVVHFQHLLHIGVEAIRIARNVLPRAALLVTLHEYGYICHADGQMLETSTSRPCARASAERCHRCFSHFTPTQFFLRERFIKSHLALVDRFIAPSHFLAQRYVEWGLPAEKITFIEYGRRPRQPLPPRPTQNGEGRGRFGYFGQVNPYKGVDVLLEALALLGAGGGPAVELHLNGANLDWQSPQFRDRLSRLAAGCNGQLRDLGPYRHAELAERMALVDWVVVPSIWWENSPLVIQEAFLHGRPVICSDIGGMKEKVRDGVDGLHFAVGDAQALAGTLARAAQTSGLWERLRSGIPRMFSLDDAVAAHMREYEAILRRRTDDAIEHELHA
jgi:glycosyltransferase involved in cell wall biosynthesis